MKFFGRHRDFQSMPRLRWGAYAASRVLGRCGLLAAALLVATLAVDFGYMRPTVAALHDERDRVTQELEKMPNLRLHEGKPGMTLRDVQQLRNDEQAYSVFELLKRHGMSGLQAAYSQKVEAKGTLRRVSIDISMTGRYADLRLAMKAIANQPMSRIENVSIVRDHIENEQVSVRLRVSLLGPDS